MCVHVSEPGQDIGGGGVSLAAFGYLSNTRHLAECWYILAGAGTSPLPRLPSDSREGREQEHIPFI